MINRDRMDCDFLPILQLIDYREFGRDHNVLRLMLSTVCVIQFFKKFWTLTAACCLPFFWTTSSGVLSMIRGFDDHALSIE